MNKRKKTNIYIVVFLILLCVLVILNIGYIRDFIARQNGTISFVNAKLRMEKALKEKYPNYEFEFIKGEYKDVESNYDDASYTGKFAVNGNKDKIIEVVCSDKDYENSLIGNFEVKIQTRKFQRMCSVVDRIVDEYKSEIIKNLGDDLSNYIYGESDIRVKSLYQDPAYPKQLPPDLQYGMKFDKDLPLDFEFDMIIQFYENGEEQVVAEKIMNLLNLYGFHFLQYDFMFKDENELKHYVYGADRNCIRVYRE